MLQITIPAARGWDERKQQFVYVPETVLQLEHSLVSVARWESKWCKPFLTKSSKTYEETLDYIKCMTLNEVKPEIYEFLTEENVKQISDYMYAPMTATTFSDDKQPKRNSEIITAELVYYWMISLNIPPEYDTWHINRLFTLIKVCSVKNAPPKKMSKKDLYARNAALNAARKKQLNSKG